MFRFLVFLLLVLGLGLLFAWVADNPGTIFVQWEWLATRMGRPGEEVGIPLTLAMTILVGLIFTVMLTWGIIRNIIGAPSMLSRFLDNRKREKGYKALSKGLIAASSGDASTARKLTKESKKLLGTDPLVSLLGTQTAILEGKRDEARENFKAMLSDESTRMVALRGLFLEAERQGEPEAARHYAEEACKTDSSLPWAGNAKLRYAASEGDWDSAIKTLDSNRAAGLIDKTAAKRQRAVLLTGKAMAKEAEEPDYAAKLAKEAHKLLKDFVPAAVTYARIATRLGDTRAASKVIEATWKLNPHPELAEAYYEVRSGDSVQERFKRGQRLLSLAPQNTESKLAYAAAAIDAGEWKLAREALEPILTTKPTERACLLMADIEEGQNGDKGRMRDWLARAVRAEPEAQWVAGSHVSNEWLPISPITGEIDAFEWKVPVQQLGSSSAPVMTLEELKAEAATDEETEIETIDDAQIVADEAVSASGDDAHQSDAKARIEETSDDMEEKQEEPKGIVISADAAASAAVGSVTVKPAPDQEEDKPEVEVLLNGESSQDHIGKPNADDDEKTDAPENMPEPQNDNTSDATHEVDHEIPHKLAGSTKDDGEDVTGENGNTVEFPLKRRPDDPGPHPDKEPPKKGFKLF